MNKSNIYDLSSYCDDIYETIKGLGYANREIDVLPLLYLYDNQEIPNDKLLEIKEGDIVYFEDRFSIYLVIKFRQYEEYYHNNSRLISKINNNNNLNNDLCLIKFTYDEDNECIFIPVEGLEFDIDYFEFEDCEGQIIDLYYLKKEFNETIDDLSNQAFDCERLLIKRQNTLAILDCCNEIKYEYNHINSVLLPIMRKNDQVNNITHIITILKNLEDKITESNGITIHEYINKKQKKNDDNVKSLTKMKKNELLEFTQKLIKDNEVLKSDAKLLEEDIQDKNIYIETLMKEKRLINEKNKDILSCFLNFKKDILKNIDNIEKMIKKNNIIN